MQNCKTSVGTTAHKSSKSPLLFRQAALAAIFLLAAVSCTHKKDGWIIKGQDGKLYRLEDGVADEAYRLREIDSVALNRLSK